MRIYHLPFVKMVVLNLLEDYCDLTARLLLKHNALQYHLKIIYLFGFGVPIGLKLF